MKIIRQKGYLPAELLRFLTKYFNTPIYRASPGFPRK